MDRVLILDDEPLVLHVFTRLLAREGREILGFREAGAALDAIRSCARLDAAIVDKNLGDRSGLDVARELLRVHPDAQVILVTGYASLDSAIEAVRLGAYDYVTKPVDDFAALELKVSNAIERARLARERKELARRLAESEERWRGILLSAPDAIVTFEAVSERIREVNPAALELYGYSREEMLDLPVGALFAPPAPEYPGAWSDPAAVLHRRRDGTTFSAELRPGELVLRGEALRTFVVRDVSARERAERERREVEAQLRQAQKMDALGRLAGGLGHDLGNMLAVVLSGAEMAAARAPPELREDLLLIDAAAERAANLVRQMMALSRRTVAAPVLLAANEAVGEAMRFLRRVVGEHVQVTTVLAPDAWSTRIDPGQLAQVLMNLVVNARDAMPGGGRLTIETRNAPGERDPAGADGDYVCVAVSDTGCGMSEEVQARIFEPFFTTKDPGKGTGLGLSMVYGIVRGAGGFVRFESAPGAGTRFHVFLPRAQGAAQAGAAARSAGAGGELGGDLTVLVAEDEEPLRQLVVRSLGQLGVRVLHGCDGEDALAVARRHRGRIDLLVTDVVMPRLSGPDLAAALGRDRPGLKVLYMSGFPRDGNLEGAGAVLEKPFRQSALLEQVRRLVAG